MPKWALPAIALVLLIGAMVFRWEAGPQKTFPNAVVSYTHDRWSGQDWLETYFVVPERIETVTYAAKHNGHKPAYPYLVRNILTGIWLVLVCLNGIWLFKSIKPR